MRAMICRKWGSPEDLRLGNLDHMPLTSERVRVKVRAAGVIFSTTPVIAGKYQRKPPLPFIPGTEASGVVIEVGAACRLQAAQGRRRGRRGARLGRRG